MCGSNCSSKTVKIPNTRKKSINLGEIEWRNSEEVQLSSINCRHDGGAEKEVKAKEHDRIYYVNLAPSGIGAMIGKKWKYKDQKENKRGKKEKKARRMSWMDHQNSMWTRPLILRASSKLFWGGCWHVQFFQLNYLSKWHPRYDVVGKGGIGKG